MNITVVQVAIGHGWTEKEAMFKLRSRVDERIVGAVADQKSVGAD